LNRFGANAVLVIEGWPSHPWSNCLGPEWMAATSAIRVAAEQPSTAAGVYKGRAAAIDAA
jgi:hypothetical protein